MGANQTSFKNKYKNGDIINGMLFVKRIDGRDAEFECPFCKKIFQAGIRHVATGATSSCGCRFMGKDKHFHTTYDGYRSPEYICWYAMRKRCLDPTFEHYHRYGGAGITICAWWDDFNNFLSDMGPRPSRKHTLDRYPDTKGNYEPSNCRWATKREQVMNRTNTVKVVYKGQEKALDDWCKELGLNYFVMWSRIFNSKFSVEKAFETPIRKRRPNKKRRFKPSNFIPHSFGVMAA